jgi:hypothetical protein
MDREGCNRRHEPAGLGSTAEPDQTHGAKLGNGSKMELALALELIAKAAGLAEPLPLVDQTSQRLQVALDTKASAATVEHREPRSWTTTMSRGRSQ